MSRQTLLAAMKRLHDAVASWPQVAAHYAVMAYYQVAQPMVETSEGRRTCWAIGAVNAAIFLLWRFPSMKPFLTRHFTHDPLSGKTYTMFTSLFRYAVHGLLLWITLNNASVTRTSFILCSPLWRYLASVGCSFS